MSETRGATIRPAPLSDRPRDRRSPLHPHRWYDSVSQRTRAKPPYTEIQKQIGEPCSSSAPWAHARSFITQLGAAAAMWPAVVRAQQPSMPRIGFLHTASSDPYAPMVTAFRNGCSANGGTERPRERLKAACGMQVRKIHFPRSDCCEPLSGPPAFAVRDSAASSLTLARIGPNGPNRCCSAGKPSA